MLGLLTVDIDDTLIPKSKSSPLALCVFKTFLVHAPSTQYRIICNTVDTPHIANHIPNNVVGAICRTSVGRLLRRTTSHTKVTPETRMLAAAAISPPVKSPHVFVLEPSEWLFRYLTYKVEKYVILARFIRAMAKAMKSSIRRAERT